jgi:hypothetical protein
VDTVIAKAVIVTSVTTGHLAFTMEKITAKLSYHVGGG